MSRKFLVAVLVIVALVVVIAMNGDRLYDWLLAMHGVHPAH